MSKNMIQEFEYNSEKNAFKVAYDSSIQDSLLITSVYRIELIFEQIN